MNIKNSFNFKKVSTLFLTFCLVVMSLFQFPIKALATSTVELQMYNSNLATATNEINPFFKFTNTGSTSINLSEIKLRYYYTKDGSQTQNFTCDYSSVGTSKITGTFVDITFMGNADSYLEVGFTSDAGSLSPGATVVIQTRVNKSDYSNYNQANDYSFDASNTAYVNCNKSTIYQNGMLVCGTPPAAPRKFLVIASNPLYQTGDIASKISTYMSDLSYEGWASTLVKINNVSDFNADYICSTRDDLKNVIESYYNNGYEGFVLIGSSPQIPTAYWEQSASDSTYDPTDLYYADMDKWTDSDADGRFESYDINNQKVDGSFSPEMFWGRISAAGVTGTSTITDDATKICSYFDKIHTYRVNGGNLSDEQKKRALLFYDSDFKSLRQQGDLKSLVSEIHGLYDDSLTTPDRLAQELQKGYAFVDQQIHSNNTYHQIHTWNDDILKYDNTFTLDTLNSIIPKVNYINMYSCSSCKYQDSSGHLPNFGETYLFNNDYVINVTGSTGEWGPFLDKKYWDDIAAGKPIGQAYKDLFKLQLGNWYRWSPDAHAVLLGDPTMSYKISPVTNQAPHITTNLAGLNHPNKARLEIMSDEQFVINAIDPENNYVTIDIEGLPSGAVVSKSDKRFTWTPSISDADKIYNLTATAYNKDSNNNIINKYVENFTVKVLSGKFVNTGFEYGLSPEWGQTSHFRSALIISDLTTIHGGQKSIRILANEYTNDCRYTQLVHVDANSNYRLSGYIKTKDVMFGKGATLCASFSPDYFPNSTSMITNASQGITGTQDWTYVSLDFNTGTNTSVAIQCRLGLYDPASADLGLSSGSAWFDDLSLEKIS